MPHDKTPLEPRLAFEAKHQAVRKALKALHVEVEMFRLLCGDRSGWDEAATLAEVEQLLKQALTLLREETERGDEVDVTGLNETLSESPRHSP